MKRRYMDYDNIRKISDDITTITENISSGAMGLPTGIKTLDDRLCGLGESEYIIIAGRPSMGKTSLAVDIASEISREKVVVVFSLEMNHKLFVERLIANTSKISYYKLKRNKVNKKEQKIVDRTVEELKERLMFIDDSSQLSPSLLVDKLKWAKENIGLDCVIIDYLQLMTSTRNESRQQEITDISRELKAASKDFNIPFVVLSQLSRAVEYRTDTRPRLSDLRESGSIEQDSHKVLLLYRPQYYEIRYDFDSDGEPEEAEIIVAKNRSGPTGSISVNWMKEYMSFEDK